LLAASAKLLKVNADISAGGEELVATSGGRVIAAE
jgi:hypothetical protein